MRQLIQGILEFRATQLAEQKAIFSKLALGQKPDALFIACSDSRVVPNVFASTKPGDLLVQRCVGNIVPPCPFFPSSKSSLLNPSNINGSTFSSHGLLHPEPLSDPNKCCNGTHQEFSDSIIYDSMACSEAAAIEFSICNLKIQDIIVCGHSECGAMISLVKQHQLEEKLTLNSLSSKLDSSYQRDAVWIKQQPHEKKEQSFLQNWLRNGEKAVNILSKMNSEERHKMYPTTPNLSIHNQLAQINIQNQIENLLTYPLVQQSVKTGAVRLHGWYFDIASCSVYTLLENEKKWVVIDENVAPKLMEALSPSSQNTELSGK